MNYILIFKIGWWFQKKPLNSPSCDKNSDKQESMSTIKNLQLTSNSVMKTLGLGTRQGAPSHHSYFKRPARALRQEKEKKRTHVWERQNRSCLQMAVSAHLADPPKLLMTDCTVWVRDSKAFTLFCSGSNSWTVRIQANRCPSFYRTWQTQQCPLLPSLLPSPSFSHLKGLWQTCKGADLLRPSPKQHLLTGVPAPLFRHWHIIRCLWSVITDVTILKRLWLTERSRWWLVSFFSKKYFLIKGHILPFFSDIMLSHTKNN